MSDKGSETKELIDDLYKKIDSRIKDISETVKEQIIPEAESTMKKNIFTTVMVSFGAGLILGLLLAFTTTKKGKK